jgi:hypothetical protein
MASMLCAIEHAKELPETQLPVGGDEIIADGTFSYGAGAQD